MEQAYALPRPGRADITNSDVSNNVLTSSPYARVLGGAGIFNNGQLTVTGTVIKGNSVTTTDRDSGSAAGASIGNFGTLTLDHSTVENNTMSTPGGGTGSGSGVWNAGTFHVDALDHLGQQCWGCRLRQRGGGVYGATGKMDLIDTRITKNKVSGSTTWGAGVALSDSEHVDITVKDSPSPRTPRTIAIRWPRYPPARTALGRLLGRARRPNCAGLLSVMEPLVGAAEAGTAGQNRGQSEPDR